MANAAKFTHEGEIELLMDIEEEKEGKLKLHITVKDSGIGIPSDKLDTIFQAFQQADGSTTRKYGGTGLGLAIVRRVIDWHGGTVQVSEAPLGGARLTLCWPGLKPPLKSEANTKDE